jgi:hypothetical protein
LTKKFLKWHIAAEHMNPWRIYKLSLIHGLVKIASLILAKSTKLSELTHSSRATQNQVTTAQMSIQGAADLRLQTARDSPQQFLPPQQFNETARKDK